MQTQRLIRGIAIVLTALALIPSGSLRAAEMGHGSGSALFAASQYWYNFVEFWTDAFQKQNGVVMIVLAAGALSLFIITRGKKLK